MPELQGQIPTAETFHQVAPVFALQIHGPVYIATIQPSPDRQAVLSEYDIPVKTKSGLVLFDTGAEMSCIDESAATEMLLPIVGTGRARGVNFQPLIDNSTSLSVDLVFIVPMAAGTYDSQVRPYKTLVFL